MDEIDLLDMALECIRLLKRGDCWCEMAIDNPMVREHSAGCLKAKQVMKEVGE